MPIYTQILSVNIPIQVLPFTNKSRDSIISF